MLITVASTLSPLTNKKETTFVGHVNARVGNHVNRAQTEGVRTSISMSEIMFEINIYYFKIIR